MRRRHRFIENKDEAMKKIILGYGTANENIGRYAYLRRTVFART